MLLILKAQNPVHSSNQLQNEENEEVPAPTGWGVAQWTPHFSSMRS